MTALWLVSVLSVIGYGVWAIRIPYVQRLEAPSRVAVMLAVGTATAGLVMLLLSVAGIRWTYLSLAVPLVLSLLLVRRGARVRIRFRGWIAPAIFVFLTLYAGWSARITNPDFLFFWGPKGVHFHAARGLDAAFLKAPHYRLMHSDYPPLLPMVYAFGSSLAGRFSWHGALLLPGIYLAAAVAGFRGMARTTIGEERASLFATLLASVLAYTFVRASVGGTAEPLLILFLVMAVSALTFGEDAGAYTIAALALGGAVLTKVEGSVLAATVIAAFALTSRSMRRAVTLALIPAAVLMIWLLFANRHGLIDSYAIGKTPIHVAQLPTILRLVVEKASYNAFYLPWIAVLSALAIGRTWRPAALPLLVSCGSIGAVVFYYLHSSEPERWIRESVDRVLLPTLATLVIAAAAAAGNGVESATEESVGRVTQ